MNVNGPVSSSKELIFNDAGSRVKQVNEQKFR